MIVNTSRPTYRCSATFDTKFSIYSWCTAQQIGYIENTLHNKGTLQIIKRWTDLQLFPHLTRLKSWKVKSIFAKIRNMTRISSLSTFIQLSIRSLNQSKQAREEMRHPNKKGKRKLSYLQITHYIHKNSLPTKKPLELINLVNFQDRKSIHINLLHFHILIMNYQNERLRKQSHFPLYLPMNKDTIFICLFVISISFVEIRFWNILNIF